MNITWINNGAGETRSEHQNQAPVQEMKSYLGEEESMS